MTEIEIKYQELGGLASFLGQPTSEELSTGYRNGKYRHYSGGSIYWHPFLGAHEVHGAIRDKWARLGWERSLLGFPETDQRTAPDRVGRYNHFQHGSIYLYPGIGAYEIHGKIRDKWESLGWERSFLKYPTTDERITPDGIGRYNHFQGGSIYWHPDIGAHEIHGTIRSKWASLGWERSFLGYPVSDEMKTEDGIGRYSIFEKGIIIWNPNGGAKILPHSVYKKWAALNFMSGALGNIKNGAFDKSGSFQLFTFEHGILSNTRKIHRPLTIYAQNMAFRPTVYKGSEDRDDAVAKLIEILRRDQPAIVGLSEVFNDSIREKIQSDLNHIYPFFINGPEERGILNQDGGLLILSQFRIVEDNSSIFRVYNRLDGLADKGVLHARIEIPGQGISTFYDIYLSHTQDPKDGDNRGTVNKQLSHIHSFIEATRNPSDTAILMGDLNTDVRKYDLAKEFNTRLHSPMDSWILAGDTEKWPHGITSDTIKAFNDDQPDQAIDAPERHQNGSRIDFIVARPGKENTPDFSDTKVFLEQIVPGRDLSDHYGVRTTINGYDALTCGINRTIQSTRCTLNKIHCLKKTESAGKDEIFCTLYTKNQNSTGWESAKSNIKNNVKDAYFFNFRPSPSLVITSPGEWIEVRIRLKEHDIGRDDLIGDTKIRIKKEELLETINSPVERTFPVLNGSGAEYVVTIKIESYGE